MSQALDTAFAEMETAVEAQTDAQQSAVTLLNRIAQLIADASAGGDAATVAKLTALKNQISANAADLAAAVVANTPAENTSAEPDDSDESDDSDDSLR